MYADKNGQIYVETIVKSSSTICNISRWATSYQYASLCIREEQTLVDLPHSFRII